MDSAEAVEALITRTEETRIRVSDALSSAHRADLGQYFTPSRAAALIAGMPRLPTSGHLRILDPGAGAGSLTAAFVARALREAPGLELEVVAVEVDPAVVPSLESTLADCRQVTASLGTHLAASVVTGDLIAEATGFGQQFGPLAAPFDLVIMNPPYRKLGARSPDRLALMPYGVDCPNLYCAFLSLGVLLLKPQGQLVAITPRSFANGAYFGGFRRFFLTQMRLDRLHVFESRSTVFADSDVLQENIVFGATKQGTPAEVVISSSRDHTVDANHRSVPYSHIVKPEDPNRFIHFPAGDNDANIAQTFASLPCKLPDLDLRVSTGRVVDFRARDYLLDQPVPGSVPLIYPGNLKEGRVLWPLPIRKSQALLDCDETQKLLLPAGCYVLVKRFSAKEEPRRVVAVVCYPDDLSASKIGFENHLNVFHRSWQGLDEDLARGLCAWLNSTAVDMFFRTFSGHTQVNATDLRSLRYPSCQKLVRLGEAVGHGAWPDQEKTDALVTLHILTQESVS